MRVEKALAADGALLAITVLWGVTFVTVKDALTHADPITFLVMRFGLGALVAALLARRALAHAGVWRTGLLLSVFLFLGFAFQTWGLKHTTPSRSAFITGLCMVMVPFFSWWHSKRRPSTLAFAGTVVATAGLFVLTDAAQGTGLALGDGLTLLCTFAYAMHIVLTEKYAGQFPPTALVAVQLTGVTLCALLCLPFVDRNVQPSTDLLIAVLICGVLASGLAISIYTWAQARTSAVHAALIFSLEPVIAAFWSAALGREVLGARELTGGALVVAGVLLAEVGGALWSRAAAVSNPVHRAPAVESDLDGHERAR